MSEAAGAAPSTEPLPGRTVEVDGAPLHVVEHGAGPPVLLIHGVPSTSYVWRNVQRALAGDFRTIAYDLLGLGKSGKPRGRSYALGEQARLAVALLDALGVAGKVPICGTDFGGAVAERLAVDFPARLSRLALLDPLSTSRYWPAPQIKLVRLPLVGELVTLFSPRLQLTLALRRGIWHKERVTEALVASYLEPLATLEGRRAFLRFVRSLDAPAHDAVLERLFALPPPTLLLWGREDVWQPWRLGEWLRERIAGATLHVFDRCGHILQEDYPLEVAAKLREFLAG